MLLEVKRDFADVLNWKWSQKLCWKFLMTSAGGTSRRWLGLDEAMKVSPKMAAVIMWRGETSHQLAHWSHDPILCCYTARTCSVDMVLQPWSSQSPPLLLPVLCGCSCPLQNPAFSWTEQAFQCCVPIYSSFIQVWVLPLSLPSSNLFHGLSDLNLIMQAHH